MGRLIPDVPRFERSAPEPPPWLSEQARAAWEAIAPELEALGLIKIQDGLMLTALCESWATYVAALARVRAEGLTIVNPKTLMEHRNPALTALEVAGRDLLRYTHEFGLTPVAPTIACRRMSTIGPGFVTNDSPLIDASTSNRSA